MATSKDFTSAKIADGPTEQKLYETALSTISAVTKLPLVKVNREKFLSRQFANSPHLEHILAHGPQSVYTAEALQKKAHKIVRSNTTKTAVTSFVSGLPTNPLVMVPAGGAEVAQYFGFAIHMAQQIAYLFGEDELFTTGSENVPEEAKVRILAYLGAMFGASGAAALIAQTSKVLGQNVGKKVAAQALTKTAWYPLLKKSAALVGQKITKKTVEKTIIKAVPVVGGVVSSGLTVLTFRPMGYRLTEVFVEIMNGAFDDELELKPEFADTVEARDQT